MLSQTLPDGPAHATTKALPSHDVPTCVADTTGHVLLITPLVFGYHRAIERELHVMGFETTWWDDRAQAGSLAKLALRLWPAMMSKRLTPRFAANIARAALSPVSHVLVVKGEGLSGETVAALRRQWPLACLSLYLWDSIDNHRGAAQIAPLFDHVATFDPVDAARHAWMYRPLFARDEALGTPVSADDLRYDWSFIGTLHSDRHRILRRLRRTDEGKAAFVFGYIPGRLVKALRLLTDWSLWTAEPSSVSTQPLPAERVARICAQSRAIIDIEHPRQRGLTMRTIETLLAGRKLVTSNRHVLQSDLYDETRVHVIDRLHPAVPAAFLASDCLPIPERIREKYTLRRWITDLLATPRVRGSE